MRSRHSSFHESHTDTKIPLTSRISWAELLSPKNGNISRNLYTGWSISPWKPWRGFKKCTSTIFVSGDSRAHYLCVWSHHPTANPKLKRRKQQSESRRKEEGEKGAERPSVRVLREVGGKSAAFPVVRCLHAANTTALQRVTGECVRSRPRPFNLGFCILTWEVASGPTHLFSTVFKPIWLKFGGRLTTPW